MSGLIPIEGRPRAVQLYEPLEIIQQRWLGLPRKQQDELYASEIAPAFAPRFAKLPLHGAPDLFHPLIWSGLSSPGVRWSSS